MRTIILCLIVLFSISKIRSQNCSTPGITFHDQQSIDHFFEETGGCTIVDGNLNISEEIKSSILDLSGLYHIKVVRGDLNIKLNASLTNLNGLSGIDSVYGCIVIQGNDSLFNLDGLNHVKFTGHTLWIDSQLSKMTEFTNLDSVPALNLNIPNAVNFEAFPRLKYLQSLFISTGELDTLGGFNMLYSVDNVIISGGENLSSLAGLKGLTKTENFKITKAGSLSDLSDFVNLHLVTKELNISDNDHLISLSGLESINADSIDRITITDNVSLSDCSTSLLCESFTNPTIKYYIHNNLNGCNSFFEIAKSCSNQCPINLEFNSQSEIDSFPLYFPNCKSVDGNLKVYDLSADGITNLDSLYIINSVGGNLELWYNLKLIQVKGLRNISTLGGDLIISGNTALVSLSGFDQIRTIGNLLINMSPLLPNLEGLHHLQEVDNVQLYSLSHIAGLNELKRVNGDFYINGHLDGIVFPPVLDTIKGKLTFDRVNVSEDLSGSTSLKSTGGFELNETNISSLSPFSALTQVRGDMYINYNPILTSLSGLNQLESVNGNIAIEANTTLRDLSFLKYQTALPGNLSIAVNDSLKDLSDLSGLKSIAGSLHISGNDLFQNLSGLENLKSIGSDLNISSQYKLTNLSGLDNLVYLGNSILLYWNTNLEHLTGLERIDTIYGDLKVNNCKLVDFTDLNQLVYVGGLLDSYYNPLLSFTGLDSLKSVGKISVTANMVLENLDALNNLEQLRGGISIDACPKMTHLPTLKNIKSIPGNLNVSGNNNLVDFTGMDSLKTITGSLTISGDKGLVSLKGLQNLESIGNQFIVTSTKLSTLADLRSLNEINGSNTQGNVVQIQKNTYLKVCDIPPVCQNIQSDKKVIIEGNDFGCANVSEVQLFCDEEIHCIRSSISLYRQGLIDSFNLNNPGCGLIQGNLVINEQFPGTIFNLDSLYKVKALGGSLTIGNNLLLNNLHGLENLKIVGTSISIVSNKSLTDISAISGVDLDQLGGNNYAEYQLNLTNNSSLSDCSSPFMCDLITRTTLGKRVTSNNVGCSTVLQIAARCNFPETCRLDTIYTDSDVWNFHIKYPTCTTLENGIVVLGNVNDLAYLDQIQHIQGEIHIENSNYLTSLHGLHNITSMNGPITLANNKRLQDIHDLENIDPTSVHPNSDNYQIRIENNAQLPECATQPICSVLTDHPEMVIINNNLTGCNTQEEVHSSCLVGTIYSDQVNPIKIYPNPTSGEIFIETGSENTEDLQIVLLDQMGKIIFQRKFSQRLSLDNLTSGIYTICLTDHVQRLGYFRVVLMP